MAWKEEEIKVGVKDRKANMTSICSLPVFYKNYALICTKLCEPVATVNSIWFSFDIFKIWSCLASLVGPVYIIGWNNNLVHIYCLINYSFDWILPFALGGRGRKFRVITTFFPSTINLNYLRWGVISTIFTDFVYISSRAKAKSTSNYCFNELFWLLISERLSVLH